MATENDIRGFFTVLREAIKQEQDEVVEAVAMQLVEITVINLNNIAETLRLISQKLPNCE
jgi:hypothetical protein